MDYRVAEIAWTPPSKKAWATFSGSRREAARLWNDLVIRHRRIRKLRWKWPTKSRWEEWAAKKYPNIHSQTAQMIIGEFIEACTSIVELRKNSHSEARFPWKTREFRDCVYSNQAALIRNGRVVLPNGKAGKLKVKIPKGFELPGRLMESRLSFGRLLLVCKVSIPEHVAGPIVGVDLGVNTLLAATDGVKTLLISGREAKATVQWRNKKLASAQSSLAAKKAGSRRQKRLQRRKYRMLEKARNRIKDINQKATSPAPKAFPGAKIY